MTDVRATLTWFLLASFSPAVLLLLAALFGGVWPVAALIWITVFVWMADRWTKVTLRTGSGLEGTALRINIALGILQVGLLPVLVWAMASGGWLSLGGVVVTLIAAGLYYGQVANSNAHELIHHGARWPRRLGVTIYCMLLFGHHASAHPLVHHVHVATDRDPNSARKGESFWRFWPRAWIGSWRAGRAAETERRSRRRPAANGLIHPYVIYVLGAAGALAVAWLVGGLLGVGLWTALAVYAQMQLILSDYVQHYGLRRVLRPDGRAEPVGPRHSWNAAPWFSGAMMLNAPRHSDHHAHPSRAFPDLRLERGIPMLPRSLPVMGAIALVPPLWRRIMDRRVDRWSPALSGGALQADLAISDHETDSLDSSVPAGRTGAG